MRRCGVRKCRRMGFEEDRHRAHPFCGGGGGGGGVVGFFFFWYECESTKNKKSESTIGVRGTE